MGVDLSMETLSAVYDHLEVNSILKSDGSQIHTPVNIDIILYNTRRLIEFFRVSDL